MPAQQRLRPHQERPPRATRQHPAECSQEKPVAWRELRPPHLPPQDRQLMPQHQDLKLLRALTAPEQHDQLEQTACKDVHQRRKQEQPPRRRNPTLSAKSPPTSPAPFCCWPSLCTVSVLGSRLGLLSGWCRCSLFVTHLCNDSACGCLRGDMSGRRDRCQPGARLLA
jgi:hypothetical protein